jgi:phosphonate transport system substrate-binding protein
MLLLAVSASAAVCGCFPELKAKARRPVVRLCVLPRYSPRSMSQRYAPLAEYLSEATGYDVRYVASLNYETYPKTVEWSGVDIGFHNPLVQVALAKSRGARPLLMATEPTGEAWYRGVIIARMAAGIRTLGDLRGKRIATASRLALAGYVAQQALCQDAGVDLDRECAVVLVRGQEQAVAHVAEGRADAAFVAESIWLAAQDTAAAAKLDIIAYTEYLPGWCVAVFPDANAPAAEAIKQALLALKPPHGRVLLGPMDTSGFVETTEADYEPARRLAAKLDIPL